MTRNNIFGSWHQFSAKNQGGVGAGDGGTYFQQPNSSSNMFPNVRVCPYQNFIRVRFLFISSFCTIRGSGSLTSSKSSDVITFGGGAGATAAGKCGTGFVGTLEGVEDGFARSWAASTKHIRLSISSISRFLGMRPVVGSTPRGGLVWKMYSPGNKQSLQSPQILNLGKPINIIM